MQTWFTLFFFDKLLDIHIMINRHLSKQIIHWTVSHDYIMGSSHVQLIKVSCFGSFLLTKVCFSIGSRAHVKLAYWKQGRIVCNANNIFFYRCNFFCCFVLCVWQLCRLETKGQTIYVENLSAKLQNSNQNSTFSWVSLNSLWTILPRSYACRLA